MAKAFHRHIHRKVLMQLGIIAVAALILVVLVARDAVLGDVGPVPIIVAVAIGLCVGYLAGRMFRLLWHEDTKQVVIRMDKLSFILIGLYVAFRIGSAQLLGDYWSGAALSAISFAVLDGILIGRLISMWRGISRILREQGIVR
jgi:hypothetical protein